MKLDWQKIAVIILFILAALLMGFFIYWFFWRPLIGPISLGPTVTTTTELIGAGPAGTRTSTPTGTGGLSSAEKLLNQTDVNPATGAAPTRAVDANVLVNEPTYFTSIKKNGEVCYYNQKDSKLYKVDSNGNIEALSEKSFFGLSNAVFDKECERVILQYPDGSNITYDLTNEKQYSLPKHWQDFGFSDTGEQIAFKNIGLDVENRYLVASKYDGSQAKILEQIGENAYKVNTNWSPNNQVVATYIEGLDANRSQVYFIGQNNENFKSMIIEGRDFNGVWSPSGNRMLYSVYDPNNEYKPALWISSAYGESTGGNRQKISLETWADKCTFATENYALCITPQSMPSNAGLDRENLMTGVADSIWAVDLTTGSTALVAIPNNITNIEKIYFSNESPDQLMVVNASNKFIYKINIK